MNLDLSILSKKVRHFGAFPFCRTVEIQMGDKKDSKILPRKARLTLRTAPNIVSYIRYYYSTIFFNCIMTYFIFFLSIATFVFVFNAHKATRADLAKHVQNLVFNIRDLFYSGCNVDKFRRHLLQLELPIVNMNDYAERRKLQSNSTSPTLAPTAPPTPAPPTLAPTAPVPYTPTPSIITSTTITISSSSSSCSPASTELHISNGLCVISAIFNPPPRAFSFSFWPKAQFFVRLTFSGELGNPNG